MHALTAVLFVAVGALLLSPVSWWAGAVEALLGLLGLDWTREPERFPPLLGWDKLVHFALFFGLALQCRRSASAAGIRSWWLVVLVCAGYGAVLEGCQSLTGRSADPLDALADALGAVAFVGWAAWRERRS